MSDQAAPSGARLTVICVCPTCGSDHLWLQQRCVACEGPNLQTQPLVYHYTCAHVFLQGDEDTALACPKCGQHQSRDPESFEACGAMWVCDDCGYEQADPTQFFACRGCGATFELGQASWVKRDA